MQFATKRKIQIELIIFVDDGVLSYMHRNCRVPGVSSIRQLQRHFLGRAFES